MPMLFSISDILDICLVAARHQRGGKTQEPTDRLHGITENLEKGHGISPGGVGYLVGHIKIFFCIMNWIWYDDVRFWDAF